MGSSVGYKYERLSNDNIHHLVTLFDLVYRKKISIDFIRDKYNTEYLDRSYIGHIAFDGNKPIAFAGLIPFRVKYNGIIETAAQCSDAMVIAEARRTGVFKQIWSLNEELLKAEAIAFGYAFANQYTAPFLKDHFGWKSNERMNVYSIPISGIPAARIYNKLSLRKSYDNRLNKVLGKLIVQDSFNNPFENSDVGYVVYNDDFFKYKHAGNRLVLQIDGVKVWIKTDHRFSVGQIEACSKEQFLAIVEKLKVLSRQIGLNEVLLQYSPLSKQAESLNNVYQPIQGSPIYFKAFSTLIPLSKILFSNGDIDTF